MCLFETATEEISPECEKGGEKERGRGKGGRREGGEREGVLIPH